MGDLGTGKPIDAVDPYEYAPSDGAGGECGGNGRLRSHEPPPATPWVELRRTLALFGTPRMGWLSCLFFYTGFNQPYQLVTFGDRFFTASTLGLLFSLFYVMEIVGAFAAGAMLDDTSKTLRVRARVCLMVFLFMTMTGNGVAAFLELWHKQRDGSDYPDDPKEKATLQTVLLGGIGMAAWGFSDSQVQAYAYWLIGVTTKDGPEKARAVGFYKLVQSGGWCVGFALVPTERLRPIFQLLATVLVCVVGVVLTPALPERRTPEPVTD